MCAYDDRQLALRNTNLSRELIFVMMEFTIVKNISRELTLVMMEFTIVFSVTTCMPKYLILGLEFNCMVITFYLESFFEFL